MMKKYRFERDGVPTVVLDVTEVSAYLAVTRDTVYRLIRDGQLPHVRIGKSIRVRVETLEQFVKERETTEWEAGATGDVTLGTKDRFQQIPDEKLVLSPVLWMPVSLLKVQKRTRNRLLVKRMKYVGELVQHTQQDLLTIPDFGRKLMQDVSQALMKEGLALGMRLEEFDSEDIEMEARSRFAEERCRAIHCSWMEAWRDFGDRELLEKEDERLALFIFSLGLPSIAEKALLQNGIKRVGDLVQMTSRELEGLEGVGTIAMDHIYQFITGKGLTLGSVVPGWPRPQFGNYQPEVDDDVGGERG